MRHFDQLLQRTCRAENADKDSQKKRDRRQKQARSKNTEDKAQRFIDRIEYGKLENAVKNLKKDKQQQHGSQKDKNVGDQIGKK